MRNQQLAQANQDGAEMFSDSSPLQLAPYGNYYQSVADDESLKRMYELLACFKKDMHKVRAVPPTCAFVCVFVMMTLNVYMSPQVETYLTVAKCRLSPEANCTL